MRKVWKISGKNVEKKNCRKNGGKMREQSVGKM
jgi:hypothetical protein